MKDCLLCIDQYPALSILRVWICDAFFSWNYSSWPVSCSSEECPAQKVKEGYLGNLNLLKKQYHNCTDCLLNLILLFYDVLI